MRALLIALGGLLLALGVLPPGHAEEALAPAERAAIKSVIEQQIAAFRRDDAPAAFAFASPAIQAHFGSPETFMRMVQTSYSPVYHPREVSFRTAKPSEAGIVQEVSVTAEDGTVVTALYLMEHERDGTWRINGCVLTSSEEKGT